LKLDNQRKQLGWHWRQDEKCHLNLPNGMSALGEIKARTPEVDPVQTVFLRRFSTARTHSGADAATVWHSRFRLSHCDRNGVRIET
jgi:hypothetical protein